MAHPPQPQSPQPANSIITKLRDAGGPGPAQFTGWVGSGAADGRTRLHLDINSLSYYVEFDNSDAVHWTDVPEAVMPLGAKTVWLRGDARVRLIRSVGTKASQVSRFLKATTHASNHGAVRGFMSGAALNVRGSMNPPGS
jgi:hypothetical protein